MHFRSRLANCLFPRSLRCWVADGRTTTSCWRVWRGCSPTRWRRPTSPTPPRRSSSTRSCWSSSGSSVTSTRWAANLNKSVKKEYSRKSAQSLYIYYSTVFIQYHWQYIVVLYLPDIGILFYCFYSMSLPTYFLLNISYLYCYSIRLIE